MRLVPRMREMTASDRLEKYWTTRGDEEKEKYWQSHNLRSIDGLATGMPETTSRTRR